MKAEIVKSGTWLYGETVSYEIWIVKQNFEDDFEVEYDEKECLNESGEVYKLLYANDGVIASTGPEFLSLQGAIRAAEATIKAPIAWDDHIIQPLYGGRSYRLTEGLKIDYEVGRRAGSLSTSQIQ